MKPTLFYVDLEAGLVVMDRKVLRMFLPRLRELAKTKRSWYWLYQCAKHDNLRKVRKANKAFWRAVEKERLEESATIDRETKH